MPYKDPEQKRVHDREYKRRRIRTDEDRIRARDYKRKWRKENPEKKSAENRRWRLSNPDKVKESRKKWEDNNPEKNKQIRKNAKKRKLISDPGYDMLTRLRARLCNLLKLSMTAKTHRTIELLGCSKIELKEHIERQFLSGMSWDNRHLWQIDHIIPCSSFDLTDSEQQRQCFHWSNLRPLWAEDNRKKSNKILA
jgi:hypothetical protein